MDGSWRTEYATPATGTAAAPLTYPAWCAFASTQFAFCQPAWIRVPGLAAPPTAFSRSNWVDRVTNANDQYWVVGANVEPALDSLCNSGPPNQSEPVAEPFEGIFGVRVQPARASHRPYQNEVVLAVDLSHRPRQLASLPDCIVRDYIPYLGFGIASERGGGGGPLATLGNGSAPLLRFNYRVVDTNAAAYDVGQAVPPAPRGQHGGLYVEAQWGGIRRWVWIELVSAHSLPAPSFMVPWNWGIRESFHFPGAEIVVTSGPSLRRECGADGFELPSTAPAVFADRQPHAMAIDLQRLYGCIGHLFSTPFAHAGGPVEVTGVHFFVEVGVRDVDGQPGLSVADWNSRFGVAIDNVDLVPRTGTPLSGDTELIAQMGRDLLDREWTAAEAARWQAFFATHGRVAGVRAMLRHHDAERTIAAAARIHLLAFGPLHARTGFEASLAALRGGASHDAVARELVDSLAFNQRHVGLDDAALARALLRTALQADIEAHPDRDAILDAVGSPAYWQQAIAAGQARRSDLLLAVTRLAAARGLRQTEVDTLVLYRSFLGVLPDSGGLASWGNAALMPERLIQALYYAPPYRQRFMR